MILQTYLEWRNGITNSCKIELTKSFAQKRLSVYEDNNNPETQKFIKLYGKQHLNNIITWYKQV